MIQIGKYPSIKIKSEFSMFLKFAYNQVLVDKVKSLPVRHWISENKVWEVPIDSINRVITTFGIDNIQLFTEFPEFDEYVAYREKKMLGKKTPEELKAYYKTIKCDIDYKFKTAPQGHQIEAFNIGLTSNSLFITDVMGLGKSKEAIDIVDYRRQNKEIKHCLIICGLNSIKYNWIGEIHKHSSNNVQVIDGPKKKKIEKLQNSWQFFYNVINVEILRDERMIEVLEKMVNEGYFGAIIFDECHKVGNHKSAQGSNLNRLNNAKLKIGLTGTPITKRVERLWNLLNWMGIISEPYWTFIKRYCVTGGYTGYEVIGYKNMDELHEILDRYQIRRTKEILDLPPKIYQTITVEMTKEQRKEYDEIKRGIIRDIESGDMKVVNPAVATIKLRQYTDQVKVEAIKNLIEELHENDNSAVIFSQYRDGLFALKDSLSEYDTFLMNGDIKTDVRQNMVEKFQNSTLAQYMLGTIATMGTGYTLTKSNYVIFLNKDWTCGNNSQAEDRCHRIGTTETVTVISVIVKDSVDERVEEILENDQFYIDQVVDGIVRFKNPKEMLSKLLDL